MASKKVAVILPAAGKGERFGGGDNKTFAKLDGRPIFLRSLEHFVNRDDVCQAILAVSPSDTEQMKTQYGPNLAFMGVTLVEGGDLRVQSVAAALAKLSDDAELVAVHDAVRPCVTSAMIDAVFAEAVKTRAAILAAPLRGTIKRVSGANIIEQTVPRAGLYEAQTPQVFDRKLIEEVFANLPEDLADITDDAQLVERAGHAVSVVLSDATNLKITTKPDIALANAIIKARPAKPVPRMGAFEEAQW